MPHPMALVLSFCMHHDAEGQEQPIAIAPRTLASAERNYSQLENDRRASHHFRSETICTYLAKKL